MFKKFGKQLIDPLESLQFLHLNDMQLAVQRNLIFTKVPLVLKM